MSRSILLPADKFKTAGFAANRVDPDQTPHSVASDLGLNCLLRLVCPSI